MPERRGALTLVGERELGAAPFPVTVELPGWELFWARIAIAGNGAAELAALRREVAAGVRARYLLDTLAQDPVVAALRRLFKAAGSDPSRYRPSSEALLRRLLKGEELPRICGLVDLNNCLSAQLGVPCCVMDESTLEPPFRFRAGRAGESYESLRGPLDLDHKPLLLDARGPCDTPITGSERVKVRQHTKVVWLVGYLPVGAVGAELALRELDRLLQQAPVAVRGDAFSARDGAVVLLSFAATTRKTR
ncbi:MAG TPA: phenylalanine--tRNA ligase beta subunit-related protein [Thermoanaerobaculia bacterium]|nr:phenylalanine--tRNA ligase beta subunit-related protein [Thermoanaerobaculia bacterium]